MSDPRPITDEQLQTIVKETGAHPATILRRIVGLDVRGSARQAVDAALARHGVHPVTMADKSGAER